MDSGLSPAGRPGMTRGWFCPTGKSVRFSGSEFVLCQALAAKIFVFRFSENYDYLWHPASSEGRTRRHGREAGCNGRFPLRVTSAARGGRPRRVVLIPRRWDQVGGDNPPATEANKPGTPGRARYKP